MLLFHFIHVSLDTILKWNLTNYQPASSFGIWLINSDAIINISFHFLASFVSVQASVLDVAANLYYFVEFITKKSTPAYGSIEDKE